MKIKRKYWRLGFTDNVLKCPLMVTFLLVIPKAQAQSLNCKQAYDSYMKSMEKPVAEAQTKLSCVKDYYPNHDQFKSEVYVVVVIIRE